MALQTDFAVDPDMILMSSDGVEFRIGVPHIAQAWPSLADVDFPAQTPRRDGDGRLVVELKDHSTVLSILLQLLHGLRAPLESRSPRALAALLRAARRNMMPGPEQVLLFAFRASLSIPRDASTREYLQVFADASNAGLLDIADAAEHYLLSANLEGETLPNMPPSARSRLLRARRTRINNFLAKFEDIDGVFTREYLLQCRHCGTTQMLYMMRHWLLFVRDFGDEFARWPSVDGAATHESVQTAIETLARDCCHYCRQAMFPWSQLRDELRSLADPPPTLSPPPLTWL